MKLSSLFISTFIFHHRLNQDGGGALAQPNIIVMQPDDLQYYDEWSPPPNNPSRPNQELALPSAGLPNMESLRTNGLHMLQAYTVSPMCGTSRYSTITGKYPSRAGSSRRSNSNQKADIAEITIPKTKLIDYSGQNDCSEENIAVTFKDNGYRTGMVGKWHLTRINDNSYTYGGSQTTIRGCGFDFVEGLYMENLASDGSYNSYSDGTFSHNMEWVTAEAVKFINDSLDDPFFLYFNPTVPHGSNDVRTALEDFSCRNVANGTLDSDPMIEGMTLEYGNCEDYRQSVIDRAVSDNDLGPIWVDDSIGAIITALDNKGVLDNTIFLFQQDHGMDTKSAIYENGNRIAQFIYYPNEINAGTLNVPVATIDIGPTLFDFAGITPSYTMDGISWKNALTDSTYESYLKDNRCLFFELEKDRAVRCGCHKYLKLYSQNGSVSTTFSRGTQHGFSVDLDNVFDLCGGTNKYITDPTTNMEVANSYGVDNSIDVTLEDRLNCHMTRTDYKVNPSFVDCNNPSSSVTSSPTISPTASPVLPTQISCTGTVSNFGRPSSGSCISNWSRGNTYSYPNDFEGILNSVTVYTCPTSEQRVIISNGIPDHDVRQINSISPCEKNWVVSMPLNPVAASSPTEIPVRGIIAMSINGVPAYGPMEIGSSNAVEPDEDSSITDAQFWYGHAAQQNDWHIHNPYLGHESPSESDILGYALDGFPIYGPLSDDSSLDACNGRTVNGSYRYHVRELSQVDASLDYCAGSNPANNWNYILGCYTGSINGTERRDSTTYTLPSDCVEDVSETPSPTKAPTGSPATSTTPAPTSGGTASSDCMDSTLRFKLTYNGNKITRGCVWVANKQTAQRCAVDGVSAMCSATCGTCSTCVDSSLRFKAVYNGNKVTRGCVWVANKQTAQRCAVDGMVGACRDTCGQC